MQRNSVYRLYQRASLSLALFLALSVLVEARVAAAPGFTDDKLDAALADVLGQSLPDELLRVVIVFDDPALAVQVDALALDFLSMQALPMAGAVLTADQIASVATWSGVHSITLDQTLQYTLAESIPFIGADIVWDVYGQQGDSAAVTVAVIDSGIDGLHPDLPYGQKVIQNVKMTPLGVGIENIPNTDNTSAHGTHVAGIIGGTGAFSGGYHRGVAPDIGLVGLGSGEAISILSAVQSYDWVLHNHAAYGIRVVNNSWGSSGGDLNVRDPIAIATYEAYKQGIVSVFAAGNDGGYDIMNPYSIAPWVLSVAAGDKQGYLADFSSRGADGDYYKHPDITAPGVDIYAARCSCIGVTATSGINPVNPGWTLHYAALSGTSMATPHVAGAVALLLAENPDLSPDEVMQLLITSATPMPGYELFEVGYGYMDVAAAFADSLLLPGNLAGFLAGDQDHGLDEVLGVDTDSLRFHRVTYTGFVPASVSGLAGFEYPITVDEYAVYINAHVSWDPQAQDAFDIQLLDETGAVVASSGNSAGEAEDILYLVDGPGEYTLQIVPFAAIHARYTAEIVTAVSDEIPSWPPDESPAFDHYMSVAGLYKNTGLVGLVSDYFRGGDSGFVVFALAPSDGSSGAGRGDDLLVVYTDQQGNVHVDSAVSDRDGGEYESSFALDDSWPLAPGPIQVHVLYVGAGSARAPGPVTLYYNHLDVTVQADASAYEPGDTVHFSGTVAQLDSVAGNVVSTAPLGATVEVSLRDGDGAVLASELVSTGLFGDYSGSLMAPVSTRGVVTLVAEAVHDDPLVTSGASGLLGHDELDVFFPGNLAPAAALFASSSTGARNRYHVHLHAAVSDPDGLGDIDAVELVISDADGRQLRRYGLAQFSPVDGEYLLTRSVQVSGEGPWTATLSVVDSAANGANVSAVTGAE